MDFVAVVDQAIALLRQRGRLTYRTLQLQLQLDDAHLAALKDELIEGQRLAADEAGRVLVWTGDTATPGSPPSSSSLHAPPPAASSSPDAERRQLTVLFCDLVDSTVLATQLDPEDLRAVVRAYQETCAQVIACFEGHIAQYLGDGLLAYFGYPQAHEDDAQRAVRTGLGMVEALHTLNGRLGQEHGVRLAVRVGIHTGLVVVGEMGSGGRQEQLALGDTPNIAARMQGLAAPDTVVVSAATQGLIQGYFVCRDLGLQVLKGVAAPLAVQQVVRATEAQQHFDVAAARGLTPLFVEELTKMVVESGLVKEHTGQYALAGPLPPLAIPTTLQDSLMARLDQQGLGKPVAQLGATLGREFSYSVLQAISPLDEATLQQGLEQLVRTEILYQRGLPPRAQYVFKHTLIQDTAYQSLLRSTRQQYHGHIAQVLEERFPETCASQPALVAHHYTEAGLSAQAAVYWQRAGQSAVERSAHLEAISHFRTGLALLQTVPETPERIQQALTLYVALGSALIVTQGQAAPEVAHAYTQARALCQQVGETPQLVPVLFGLWRYYGSRPQFHTARELGEKLLRLAQRADDPTFAVIAHNALGSTWFYLGAFLEARQHAEEGIARSTPDQRRTHVFRMGQDPGVACRVYAARTFWLLGHADQGLVHLHDALALAHELSHPFSLAYARCLAAYVSQFRRDVAAVLEHAEAAVALSTAQGFTQWAAIGTIMRGWALAKQGQGEEGLAQVRQGMAAFRATGAALHVPYYCTVLAEICDHLGHPDDGLQALAEAHTLVEQQEERWWEAEIACFRGVVLLRQTMPQPEQFAQNRTSVTMQRVHGHPWGTCQHPVLPPAFERLRAVRTRPRG